MMFGIGCLLVIEVEIHECCLVKVNYLLWKFRIDYVAGQA